MQRHGNTMRGLTTTIIAISAITAGLLAAQPAAPDDTSRALVELSRQVRELRIEVMSLRVAWHEERMKSLEQRVRSAEQEQHLADFEGDAAQEEILAAETQLSGADLDPAERQSMTEQKNALLTDGQQQIQQRRLEAQQRLAALRSDWERERMAMETYRRVLVSLGESTPEPARPKP